jgi:hypothetical protein
LSLLLPLLLLQVLLSRWLLLQQWQWWWWRWQQQENDPAALAGAVAPTRH